MTTGSRSRRSSTSVRSTLTYKDASSSSSSSEEEEEEEESYVDNDDDDDVVVIDISNSDDDVVVKKSRAGRTKNVGVSSSSVASTAKTSHKTSTGMAKAQVPSDAKLKAQIEEMMKGEADIETMSTKQFILALSAKYNNGVGLGSKKEFIKATIVNHLTKKTSKTTKITPSFPQSSAARSSISNRHKVTKNTTSSTSDEDDDNEEDDDNRNSTWNGALSAKSTTNIIETNNDEGFDVVIPYALLNKHTGSWKNECTMLVQVNNDDNNQHHLDFHGQSGAIGRFETSSTTNNNNVNDTNNDDGGIILDLQGYQYNGTIQSGPTAMIMALGRDGKFKVEAITDEYVTLNTTSRTDVMAKLNAVVLHQGEGGDDMSYYDGDDNVNVVRRKKSGGSGRVNADNKKNGKKKEEEHDGDTDDDDDDDDYASDANGNVKHDTKNNKRKSITKNSGDGGGLAKKKKKTLVSVAKKKD